MVKTKIYTDAQFYTDGVSLLGEVSRMVKNMTRDNKHAFGYELINLLKDVVVNFSSSYKVNDKNKKLEYALNSLEKLENLEIHLNVVKNVDAISKKQFIYVHQHLGLLLTQLYGWIGSLQNK